MIYHTLRILCVMVVLASACSDPVLPVSTFVDEPPVPAPVRLDTIDQEDDLQHASTYCTDFQPWMFEPGDSSAGVLYGVRDGRYCWAGSGQGSFLDQHPAGPDQYLGISFRTYEQGDYLRETLIFLNLLPKICVTQELIPLASVSLDSFPRGAFYTSADHGDVLEDIYRLNPRQRSFIRLETYDSISHTYTGTAEAHYVLDPNRQRVNPLNPDSFSIKSIHFRFLIQN